MDKERQWKIKNREIKQLGNYLVSDNHIDTKYLRGNVKNVKKTIMYQKNIKGDFSILLPGKSCARFSS
jgi:hypothetical protein